MAKIRLNEQQLKRIIENATKASLNRIMNEGAGWESFKAAAKEGWDDADEVSDEEMAQANFSDYIKNGNTHFGPIDYDKYRESERNFNDQKRNYERAKENHRIHVGSWKDDYKKEMDQHKDAMTRAARETNSLRPGVIGMGQRAADAAGYRLGRGAKKTTDAIKHGVKKTTDTIKGLGGKVKKGVTDFVHNNIGLEEE